ncbi:tetratricopeptide repeat protein [Nitrospira sp. M1]
MNASLCHRWPSLLVLSIVLTWGCAGDRERWIDKGTTDVSRSDDSALTSQPVDCADDEVGQGEPPHSSFVLGKQENDSESMQRTLDDRVDSLSSFENTRRMEHEDVNDVQVVAEATATTERQESRMLEQDGEPFSRIVRPELLDGVPGDSETISTIESEILNEISADEHIFFHRADEDMISPEKVVLYEISQVPFPGIEALAIPGDSNGNEAVGSGPEVNSEQEVIALDKAEAMAVLPISGRTLVEDSTRYEKDNLLSEKVGVENVQEVAEVINEKSRRVLLPTQSVPSDQQDRVQSTDIPQGKKTDEAPKLIQEQIVPPSHNPPSTIIPEDVVVSEESSSDDSEQTRRHESDRQEFTSVVADAGSPSTEEVMSNVSSTASNLEVNKEISEVRSGKKGHSLEAVPMTVPPPDINTPVLLDKELRQSLAEGPQPRSLESSPFVNVQENFVRKKALPNDSLDKRRHDVCRQRRTSLTRYQYQEVLVELSHSIQILLRADLPVQQNPELLACFRQRGYMYFQLHDYQHALSDIDQVLQSAQADTIQRSHDLFFRGRVYASMNASRRAIDDFSQALKLGLDGKRIAHAYYLRGLSHFRLQFFDPGLKDLSVSCRAEFSEACKLLEKIM